MSLKIVRIVVKLKKMIEVEKLKKPKKYKIENYLLFL